MHQINKASRRADDHLDAGRQCRDLRFVGTPAVDTEHAGISAGTGLLEITGDLHAQLARGDNDEGLGGGSRGVIALDALDQRDPEAQRLAGARLCLPDEVLPVQGQGEGHGLDGEGAFDSDVGERLGDIRRGTELEECRRFGRCGHGGFGCGGFCHGRAPSCDTADTAPGLSGGATHGWADGAHAPRKPGRAPTSLLR